jgi:4-hydroxy-2-oxoheptanedioate aldolase
MIYAIFVLVSFYPLSLVSMSLRVRLLSGGRSYGPLILSDSPVVAEALALTGYGHIVVDHEHSPTDVNSGQRLLQAIQTSHSISIASLEGRHPTEAIVRLPNHDSVYMKKVLDSMRLPGGVLVPMVEDAATAKAVVASTRYPPPSDFLSSVSSVEGTRGCAAPFVRATGWGRINTETYLKQCQEDLLVMVQVESKSGVMAIPEIAEVEGIDGIFLGPFDLSCSIGKMGRFEDEDVKHLISKAEELVLASGCLLAGFQVPGRSVKEMFLRGYSLVCGSVDMGLLRDAALSDMTAAQEAIDSLP